MADDTPSQPQDGTPSSGYTGRPDGQPRYRQPPVRPIPHYPPPSPVGGRNLFFSSCLAAGCATIIAPFVFLVGMLILGGMAINRGISDASLTGGSVSGVLGDYRLKTLRKGDGDKGVLLVVNVRGEIGGAGSALDGSGTIASLSDQLRAAAENDDVKAVLLQIDSPGGALTATDIIYNQIMNVRAQGKIVVAWAGTLMASGGYYLAAAADGIMASPTSSVGSIGVIMSRFQVSGLMDKIGVKADPIMAGASKDIGSPFRDMSPEERGIFQDSVDQAHKRFIELVAKGRGMSETDVTALANGRMFTAADAVDNGLVDRIGYAADAVAWTEELTELTGLDVVTYRRLYSWNDIFTDSSRSVGVFFENLGKRIFGDAELSARYIAE